MKHVPPQVSIWTTKRTHSQHSDVGIRNIRNNYAHPALFVIATSMYNLSNGVSATGNANTSSSHTHSLTSVTIQYRHVFHIALRRRERRRDLSGHQSCDIAKVNDLGAYSHVNAHEASEVSEGEFR